VHALSHITGGGLAANLARVLPDDVTVTIDRSTWELPPIFSLVREVGQLAQADVDEALNMGVGMVALMPAESADAAISILAEHRVEAWVAGEATATEAGQQGATVGLVGENR